MKFGWLIWLVATAAWVAGVTFYCLEMWPRLSLDLSHTDPGTRAVYDAVVQRHVLTYGAIAVVPPVLVLVLARFFRSK